MKEETWDYFNLIEEWDHETNLFQTFLSREKCIDPKESSFLK